MLTNQLDTQQISSNQIVFLIKNLKLLHNKLKEDLGDFKNEDFNQIPATSYKTFNYIEKVIQELEEKPEKMPEKVDLENLKEQKMILKNLQDLEYTVKNLGGEIQELVKVIRFYLYSDSKIINKYLKDSGLFLV